MMFYIVDRSESGFVKPNSVTTAVGVVESSNVFTDEDLANKLFEFEKKLLPGNTEIKFIGFFEEKKFISPEKSVSLGIYAKFYVSNKTDTKNFECIKKLYRLKPINKL